LKESAYTVTTLEALNSLINMRLALAYLLSIIFVFLYSCSNWKLWGEEPLGNNFFVVNARGVHAALIYCTSSKSSSSTQCDVGISIVPPRVAEYKFDNTWIIAKSKSDSGITYWIIDKDFKLKLDYDNGMEEKILSHVTGPLDSTGFYLQLQERKINLRF
jgi:hypothetical protein